MSEMEFDTPRRNGGRRAFTIIELLVVISIIAILLALIPESNNRSAYSAGAPWRTWRSIRSGKLYRGSLQTSGILPTEQSVSRSGSVLPGR